jgi:ABC-2 type transport system permease protein
MGMYPDKIRWLFWLRWKLFLRSFTRGAGRKGRIIGTILLIFVGLPFVGSIAVLTFFAYRYLPSPANAQVLFLVLTVIYALWMLLPLLEYTVNEGLDLSKLSLFPLTRAELMMSLLLSSLLDVPTLGLLLIVAAVVAGWSFSLPLALLAVLGMLIFYVQIIATSQLVLALLMRILQSRRFRDLSIVLIAVVSSSFYFLQQLAMNILGLNGPNFRDHLQHLGASTYLQWFPPGMVASAIQQAYAGQWGLSFLWLGVALLAGVIILSLWLVVVQRGLTADISGGTVRTRQQRISTATFTNARMASAGRQFLPTQMIAIAVKDLKYYRRDPQLQAGLLQSLVSIIVLVAVTLVNTGGNHGLLVGRWGVLLAPVLVLLSFYGLSYNVLGSERQSLALLFLFPVEPRYILGSKNLVAFTFGAIQMCLLIVLAALASHSWSYVVPALVAGCAGLSVMLGCGNFTSVFFPQQMRQMRRGFQTSSNLTAEAGCLRSVMSLAALLVTLLILVPVGLALALPFFFHAQWLWAFSVPASLLYGAGFYYVVTTLVASRMLRRAPEILAVVAKE